MKHFKNINSLSELKKEYRKLALANHPDKGGNTETMQEINVEFDVLFKIWQNVPESVETGEKKETAQDFRRKFYTEYGWEGSRYDSRLSTKDIAARVREYAKMKWPQYKFSVRTEYYSGGSAIHLKLVSGPEKAFKEGSTKTYISTMQNVRGFEKELTEIAFNVMNDVCDFMQSYNYDDSDGMIDYFNTNFYSHVYIGSWDKPYEVKSVKPARIKERENVTKREDTPGNIEIIDYSDKAIAVFGDTVEIKDTLKSMGGRFNRSLTHEGKKRAGWVFPKGKRGELESILNDSDTLILDDSISNEYDSISNEYKGFKLGEVVYDQLGKIGVILAFFPGDTVRIDSNGCCDIDDIRKCPAGIAKKALNDRRVQMSPAAFMAFCSCIQKRINEKSIPEARKYAKDVLKQNMLKVDQLKYIAILLSEYEYRTGAA